MVTLRGDKMYEFLDRLVTSALPRVRDFQGISDKGFDGRGNYTLGIKEQIAFPEISIDKVLKVTGMDITFVTNTDSDDEALTLLSELGLPFKKSSKKKNKILQDIPIVEEVEEVEEVDLVEEEAPVDKAPVEEESPVEDTQEEKESNGKEEDK
jgi:hypothetical protein